SPGEGEWSAVLSVALTAGLPEARGRTWTAEGYATRDAARAALGLPSRSWRRSTSPSSYNIRERWQCETSVLLEGEGAHHGRGLFHGVLGVPEPPPGSEGQLIEALEQEVIGVARVQSSWRTWVWHQHQHHGDLPCTPIRSPSLGGLGCLRHAGPG